MDERFTALLAEYDEWRGVRADASAEVFADSDDYWTGEDWAQSDDSGCDLLRRLVEELRAEPTPTSWHVEDNISGRKISISYDRLDIAERVCSSLNTPASGGGYGVYDNYGRRA